MWNKGYIKSALTIADEKKKFLFEFLPEFQAYGFFTDLELLLWEHYYKHKNKEIAKRMSKSKATSRVK